MSDVSYSNADGKPWQTVLSGATSNSIGVSNTQRRVATLAIVEDLKVVEDRVRQLDARSPSFSVDQFDLHPAPNDSMTAIDMSTSF